MKTVFIDGSAGTTGLRIHQRLEARRDLKLLTLPEALRKDPAARHDAMAASDAAFLCLPDAAAIEAAEMMDGAPLTLLDTSTAHRTTPGWAYGFPELGADFAGAVQRNNRIAVPGCHASGFIALVRPLVAAGLLSPAARLSCHSVTGYSGGGKKMIAQYEAAERPEVLSSPGIYGLGQNHKHLPEMQAVCGLAKPPVFSPIVDDYYKGMATTVPLHRGQLRGVTTLHQVWQALADHYAGEPLVHVAPEGAGDLGGKLYGGVKAGENDLTLVVAGNDEAFTVTALFDNLGKGASGAAVQNMNIMLGLPETTGLLD